MATLVREDSEYKCELVGATKFFVGKEFIWTPRLMRVTRKVAVMNMRTGKVYPVGSQFYIDLDVTQRFSIAQVTQVAEGVDTCYPAFIRSSNKSLGFGLDLRYNINRVIEAGKCPPGFACNVQDNNPYGGYLKEGITHMGQHWYWGNQNFVKRCWNTKTVQLAGYAYCANERGYATRWAGYSYGWIDANGTGQSASATVLNANGSYEFSFGAGTLPLLFLDWHRLSWTCWTWQIHQAKDWNIGGGYAIWYGTYYDPEDFLSRGVRIK